MGTGDKAEGASGDVDAEHIERDTILRNTLATPEITSGHTKFIDASGPWYDVEEGCYTYEPTLRPGFSEQQGIPSAFTREQSQFFSQFSQPLQYQTTSKPSTVSLRARHWTLCPITPSSDLSLSQASRLVRPVARNDEILRTSAGLTTADIRFLWWNLKRIFN